MEKQGRYDFARTLYALRRFTGNFKSCRLIFEKKESIILAVRILFNVNHTPSEKNMFHVSFLASIAYMIRYFTTVLYVLLVHGLLLWRIF